VQIVQFLTGKDGPDAMLFGGEDGRNVLPVPTPWCPAGAGPLAERFSLLVADLRGGAGATQSLSLADFIRRMQVPVTVAQDRDVRAYTSFRTDFLEALPPVTFIGSAPRQVAVRATPYQPDGTRPADEVRSNKDSAAAAGPSDARVRRVGEVHVDGITDFAYDALADRLFAADNDGAIWSWRPVETTRNPVKADALFPSLLATAAGGVYLYEGSARELFILRRDGATKVSSGYAEFLARGADGKSVLAIENDHTISTPDAVRRMPTAAAVPQDLKDWPAVDRFDTVDVAAIVECRPGELVYSSSGYGGSLALRKDGGSDQVLCHGLGRPGALAEAVGHIYCLEMSGRCYRLTPQGVVQWVDLTDVGFGEGEGARRFPEHGVQAMRLDVLWIASGDGVFEVDLTHARWRPFVGR
jgi:hypothetical protein